MQIEFFAPMEKPPTVTSQQKGVDFAKRRIYTKPAIKDARAKLVAAFAVHKPAQPLDGALTCSVTWVYPLLAKDGDKSRHYPHTSKPDCDNIAKLALDAMTDCGYWHDDAQVTALAVSKCRGPVTGIYVLVTPDERAAQ